MEDIKFTADDMINYAMWLAMCYAPVSTPLMTENKAWYRGTLKNFIRNEKKNKKRKFKKVEKTTLVL
jgi:hypothetical protein